MKRIGLIWTNPYSGNRGVGALTYSILYLLEQLSQAYDADFEYYLIGNYDETSKIDYLAIGGKNVRINVVRGLTPTNLKGKLKSFVFYKDFIVAKKLDYVMDMGEGDSFSDIYGITRFERFVYTKNRYNRLKIKQMLLPQTIGPFKDPIVKRKAFECMNKCQIVLSRDKQSYAYLKENNVTTEIDEIIDVAFFMPFEKDIISYDYINIGLNISALLWHGGYTRDNQFNLVVDYQCLIRGIIDYFLSIPNVKLFLVPHVVALNVDIENDYAVSSDLVKEYKDERLVLSPFFLTPISAKNFIASLDFFMGARMHATIAAFSSGVPVYPMAYSRKFNGLFVDTLNYNYMGDLLNQGKDQIMSDIKAAFENRTKLKEVIDDRMVSIVKQRENVLKQRLATFLDIKN